MDWAGFIQIGLASATPLALAALGGLFSERSGIVNIALEGKMLFGALCAVLATYWTGDPWIGCGLAILGGIALATAHFINCQLFDADHVVSGAAINILALGLTGFIVFGVFTSKSSVQVATLPLFDLSNVAGIPLLGPLLDFVFTGMAPLFLFVLFAAAATSWLLRNTPFGLRVRASGEDPAVATARGVNVAGTRFLCLLVSGALAGLAGAQLALGDVGFFTERMSAGRGFIALAAVIFGRWRPLPVLAACLFFGFAEASAVRLKLWWQVMPDELALIIPFALTLAILLVSRGASGMPLSLGRKQEEIELHP
ncbi:MAG TPA: ABC transporter permease [Acidobacteriota bacterium]|nr:ABC transporter permease [Acidobacteriota bacterium]